MSIEFKKLSTDEKNNLVRTLSYSARIAGKDGALSISDVNSLYASFIEEQIQDAGARIALGIAFGQLFADRGDFEWVRVSDEYGEETALAVVGKKITIFPISMIQKRLENRDKLNIESLIIETEMEVDNLIESGNYQSR